MMASFTRPLSFVSLLSALSVVAAQQCTLQFDGRVPGGFSAATFDAQNNVFNPANVFGQSMSVSLPTGPNNGPTAPLDVGWDHQGLTFSQISSSAKSWSCPAGHRLW